MGVLGSEGFGYFAEFLTQLVGIGGMIERGKVYLVHAILAVGRVFTLGRRYCY